MNAHADTASLFQIDTAVAAPVASSRDTFAAAAAPQLPAAATETLALVTTRAAFDALEDDWNALFERAGRSEQLFQSFNWLWHWANHFLDDGATSLAVVTMRREGRLVGLLPLEVERVLGLKQLVFMGAPVSQYGDALVESLADQPEALARALDFAIAATRADLVRLAKVRDDAALAPVLAARRALLTGAEEAPYADLAAAGSLAAYDARFSAKYKKNRRRLERRLAEHGAIALDWTLAGRPAAEAVTATMVLKRAWLKSRGQLSRALADQRSDRFFADLCAGAMRPAGTRVSLLTTGGEIANAAITVEAKGRMAVHILAYGLKFEKCAAGLLHIEKLVEHAFATGVKTIDFLAPRHDYKNEWSDGAIRVGDYAVPVTWRGLVYARAYLGYLREKLKALLKAPPRALAGPLALVQAITRRVRR